MAGMDSRRRHSDPGRNGGETLKKLRTPPKEEVLRLMREYAAKRNTIHVIRSDRGWAVTRAGAKRATRVLRDKADAVALARSLAIRDSMELMVHGADGNMLTRECY